MDPQRQSCDQRISRRSFLGTATAAGAVASAAGVGLWNPLRAEDADPSERLMLAPGTPKSRVVEVKTRHVVDGPAVHKPLLGEIVARALTGLTETSNVRDAWHAILEPNDIIGLKFNQSGQRLIATTSAMLQTLVVSLVEAGWKPEQIVCIEVPDEMWRPFGTTAPHRGFYAQETPFESGSDELAAVLGQVTAIVDIPFLKTHNIACLTCAMKNLSHAFVKHPARYHANGCSPFIADILGLPQIRSRLKLCLVDALRVNFDGGPAVSTDTLADVGAVLASFDPVAADAVGLALLNETRRREELPALASSAVQVPCLAAAHRKGLGIAVSHGIDRVRLAP